MLRRTLHSPRSTAGIAAGYASPERLLVRLRSRLGGDAVRHLSMAGDNQPGPAPGHAPSDPSPRPVWLLPRPAALALDGWWRPRFEGALELLAGPERVESGERDDDGVERDYFVARNPAGMMLWIYRERRVPSTWFLHGLFG